MNTNATPSFYRIDNTEFYANFSYPPLDSTHSEIRLLKVDAFGPDHHEILSNIPLSNCPSYCALSYACGSPENHVQLLVNGNQFNAYANLAASISEIRECWRRAFQDEQLLLWTDQICINQYDDDERSKQVSQMREIYSHASKTFVRLPASVDLGIDFATWTECRAWFKDRLEELVGMRDGGHEVGDDKAFHKEFRTGAFTPSFIKQTVFAWQELFGLAASRWWSRAWVVQEFIASPNIHFVWRPFFAPWEDVYKLWTEYKDNIALFEEWKLVLRFQIEAQEAVLCQHFILKGLSEFCESDCLSCDPDAPTRSRNICRYRNLCSVCEPEYGQSTYIVNLGGIRHRFMAHISGYGMLTMLHAKEESITLDFFNLLRLSRYNKTSEARDRVYAYVSLTDTHSIVPDYTKSLSKVFTETARAVIETTDSLNILSDTAEINRSTSPDDPLPSWVPTWTQSNLNDPIVRPRIDATHFEEVSTAQPVVRYLPNSEGNPYGVLCARGLRISKLVKTITKTQTIIFQGSFQNVKFVTSLRAEVGDEVWALYGATKLYVFRPDGTQAKLICETYVTTDSRNVRKSYGDMKFEELAIA